MKNELIIKEMLNAWKNIDWISVEHLLADGFTFTSPNDDDHINVKRYKEKCWPQAEKLKEYTIEKILEDANSAFVTYEWLTTQNKTIRNTEYFVFENRKIKSVEVFFGIAQ